MVDEMTRSETYSGEFVGLTDRGWVLGVSRVNVVGVMLY